MVVAVGRYGYVLIGILISLIAVGLLSETRIGDVVIPVLFLALLFFTMLTSGVRRRTIVTLTVIIPVVLGIVAGTTAFSADSPARGISELVSALLVAASIFLVARQLARNPVVTLRTILGALCIYLFGGLLFSLIYRVIPVLSARPFFVETATPSSVDYIYFSFVSLSTVGFGDFTPAQDVGKMAVIVEAIMGQLYLVVVVALLVSRVGLRSVRAERGRRNRNRPRLARPTCRSRLPRTCPRAVVMAGRAGWGGRRYLPLLALGILPIIWGYAWVPLKIGVAFCPPFTFAALRGLPGGLLLLGLTAALRRPVKLKAALYVIPMGVLQTGGFIGLTIAALVAGGAGRTSILANTWQFWILLMAWPILGERLRGSQWLSVGLALAGLVLIVEPWKLHGVLSAFLALAGAVCWAAGAMIVKLMRRRYEVDTLSLTGWSTLFGSVPLVLVAFLVERQPPVWSGDFIWTLAYAIVIGTCFAVFLWMYLLNSMPASIAGLGTMATPVMGLLFSWAQLGEQPTVVEGIGMVIILAGSAILFARGLREAPPAPATPARGPVAVGP